MTYEAPDGLAVAIGAFDHPERIEPNIQFGVERRIPWMDHIDDWPVRQTLDDIDAAPFLNKLISYQYPDED